MNGSWTNGRVVGPSIHDPLEIQPRVVPEKSAAAQCLAVMYHYIRDHDPLLPGSLAALSTGEFETQLDALCADFEPIDWPRLFAWTEGRAPLPSRCFLLTFDDGLADHVDHVLPILQRRGLRGTFFIPGVILTTQRLLSAHAIHLLLAALGDEGFGTEITQALRSQSPGADWWGKVDAAAAQALYHYETPCRAQWKYLLTMVLPIPLREAVIAEVFEKQIGSSARWARQWYVQWDHLKELEALGHTVGGHGYAHESYARLTPDEIRHDVLQIAAVLRQGLGPDMRPFSYPYGGVTDAAALACRQSCFVHAFTTQSRCIDAAFNAYYLPRVDTIHVPTHLCEENLCPRP